jgi:hypothetical protein
MPWRLIGSAALFCVAHGMTSSLAAAAQIDEQTLCLAAIHAFDAKDPAVVQDFSRFVENVFNALDAQRTDRAQRPISTALAVLIVRAQCQQHPTATISDEAVGAYHAIRESMIPLGSEPAKRPQPSEGIPRFRQQ